MEKCPKYLVRVLNSFRGKTYEKVDKIEKILPEHQCIARKPKQ